MALTNALEQFIQKVVDDHQVASGLKPLKHYVEIVSYASSCGYEFSLAEWGRYVCMEFLRLSDQDLDRILRADPSHWTWAFQQLGAWRAMLMPAAQSSGSLPSEHDHCASPAANQSGSDELERFVAAAKQDSSLRERIMQAQDQDEVIGMAASLGFQFDGSAILKRWNQVTDFSKPSWYGWFAADEQ